MKILFLALLFVPALATVGVLPAVASEAGYRLDRSPHDPNDLVSLQSGARVFVNYCLNCHGAQFMRFNRLVEIGLSESQIRDNLMFPVEKVGETMKVALGTKDGKEWFGVPPPDLSVIARSRGADWLYAFLRSFYRDPLNSNGWNNMVFQQVAMPHVLWQLQGEPVLDVREFKTRKEAEAAQIQAKSFSVVEEMAGKSGGKESTRYALKSIKIEKPGVLSQPQYDETVRDLVNFLVWMSEPNQVFRKQVGIVVMFFCLILVLLTWFLYKEFWKDVH